MVTPFTRDGALDLDAAGALATHLVDDGDHDGLVISGTDRRSPDSQRREKADLLRVVVDAVGDRAAVVAGVGTFNTEHTLQLAAEAAKAGADGLLVVTPYYSKPPQAGLLNHFLSVADSTDVPIMLYDIPGSGGDGNRHRDDDPACRASPDRGGQGRQGRSHGFRRVMAETELAYYSGDDAMTLPLLSIGASAWWARPPTSAGPKQRG